MQADNLSTDDSPDFAAIFEKTPGLFLVIDTRFDIAAVTDAYCEATMTARDTIIGKPLFEVFPDNPQNSAADGVANLRASLLRVLKSREADRMAVQKYDIRDGGAFVERYWSPLNIPVLGGDGYVRWIIHCVEDVTDRVTLEAERAAPRRS
jgi:PAS domain S-box-containing protein